MQGWSQAFFSTGNRGKSIFLQNGEFFQIFWRFFSKYGELFQIWRSFSKCGNVYESFWAVFQGFWEDIQSIWDGHQDLWTWEVGQYNHLMWRSFSKFWRRYSKYLGWTSRLEKLRVWTVLNTLNIWNIFSKTLKNFSTSSGYPVQTLRLTSLHTYPKSLEYFLQNFEKVL